VIAVDEQQVERASVENAVDPFKRRGQSPPSLAIGLSTLTIVASGWASRHRQ
jgi:hypothetical protein